MFNVEPFACQECLACDKPHVEPVLRFLLGVCKIWKKRKADEDQSQFATRPTTPDSTTASLSFELCSNKTAKRLFIYYVIPTYFYNISGEGEGGTVPHVIWKRNRSKSWRWPSEQTLVCAKYFIFLYLLWFPTVRGHLFIGHLSIGQISIGTFIHLYQISDRSCSSSGRLIW